MMERSRWKTDELDLPGEIWREVELPNCGGLEASNLGRLRARKTTIVRNRPNSRPHSITYPSRILSQKPAPTGHMTSGYRSGGIRVNLRAHRCVCAAFHGPPPFEGACAAHLNGNPADNRPENLIWATKKENSGHMLLHGTRQFGETASRAKLSEAQARAILADDRRASEVATAFGVSYETILDIWKGKSWKHLPRDADAIRRRLQHRAPNGKPVWRETRKRKRAEYRAKGLRYA